MNLLRRFWESKDQRYYRLVDDTAVEIAAHSMLVALRFSQSYAEGPDSQLWEESTLNIIAAEIAFAQVAIICRDVFTLPSGGSAARGAVQDDLVDILVGTYMVKWYRSVDGDSSSQRELRHVLLDLYNLSELSYGGTVQAFPQRDRMDLDDNIAGQCAIRIVKALRNETDHMMAIYLSQEVMRAYVGARLPGYVTKLVKVWWSKVS